MDGSWYVGKRKSDGEYEKFWSLNSPTEISHGSIYGYVIGPFNTEKGADFMAKYGRNNPHCRSVEEAEMLAEVQNILGAGQAWEFKG